MQNKISEVICDINHQIDELESQIALIKGVDFSKPITVDGWYKLCETPVRNSELLAVLVKNIFPQAENILVHCNYVYFDLLGFKVQIPTYRCKSINVNTDWYKKDSGEPVLQYSDAVATMKRYFELVDSNAGWYECARERLTYGKTCKKWFLFIVWWCRYKWKDPHRDQFEKKIKEQEEYHRDRVKKYYEERTVIKNKTEKLFNELIPMIEQFSTNHLKYNDSVCGGYTIEEIKKFENM